MRKKETHDDKVSQPSVQKVDEQPLIRALIAQATMRGESLAELAQSLGVSYERFSQWRRTPTSMASANEAVFVKAGQYLGIPTILAIVMGNRINLQQFVWPSTASLEERICKQMERMRQDPLLGGFVPPGLAEIALPVQLFVLFLYQQLREGRGVEKGADHEWLSVMHQAVAANVELRTAPKQLGRTSAKRDNIF